MSWFGTAHVRRMVLACVPALIAALPLLSWAQGPAPAPAPAAATDSAMKPAPAAGGHKAPMLSDSARAALRAQIDRQLREMADSLKLTPEQRSKARPILLDHAYQLKQLRDKYAGQERTPAAMETVRKEMHVLRDSTDAKLAHVLTADQMAHFKKWRDEGLTRARSKMGMTEPPGMAAPVAPAMADTAGKK